MESAARNVETSWRRRAADLVVQPFAIAVSQSAIPTLIADLRDEGLPIVFANSSFLRLSGWEEDEVLGRNLHFLHADPDETARIAARVASGEVVSEDVLLRRKDGARLSARLDIAPVFDAAGRALVLFATIVDVSDRVEAVRGLGAAEARLAQQTATFESALEQSELLSREITHRTKNALALLSAIVAAKARRAATPGERELLEEIAGRIRAIGGLQSLLDGLRSEEDGVLLRDFLERLVADLDRSAGARVVLADAPPLRLESEIALPVALCVTELVLNAQKHAFPDGRAGTVTVSARLDGNGCAVAVEDDGVGLGAGFDPAASNGLGMQVVLGQAERIAGQVTCARGPSGGARFEVTFPG